MIIRRSALVCVVATALLVSSCTSGKGSAGSAASAERAAKDYLTALVTHHPSAAHALTCQHGWIGPRRFSFVSFSDFGGRRGGREALRGMHPVAQRTGDSWTVRLFRHGAGGGIPEFRVVVVGGRDLVCGYRRT